jgi:FKBP-type peptidyl-prolyl cis-trans isomerase FkpA
MKRNILFSLIISCALISAGCLKSNNSICTNKLPSSEAAAIQAYATTNGYTMSAHSSGIYYQVTATGGGVSPLPNSKIFVRYSGRLISNNSVFDSQTDHTQTGWVLNTLIPGWQIGLSLVQEGGSIRLIIPSSLAYGCTGYASIPKDAVLFFEIDLVDVQ